ncbi:MAG: hypothetical protein ABIR70_17895 [Bryobacteraceae bacterium]
MRKRGQLKMMRTSFWAVALTTVTISFAAESELNIASIVSAADHRSGAISPGEIVVVYASNAGPVSLAGQASDNAGLVMTELAETRVLFDGQAAPLIYAVRGEIGAVVPFEVEGRASSNIVVEYKGQRSPPITLPVVASTPAIFTQNRVGTGQAGILNDSGCCNSSANPAARGTWVTLYATGTGAFQKRFPTGSIAAYATPSGYPKPRQNVRVTVGGVPAELSFVAAAPHSVAGLLQINFRIPESAPLGNAELVLSVGDNESTSLATISVRSAKKRILLASLDKAARKKWTVQFVRSGYEVVSANALSEATALAELGPIDLAIVELPQTGPSKATWVSELRPIAQGMKVLAIGSQADVDSLRTADSLGANGFVERRTPLSSVLQRIKNLVKRQAVIYDAGPPWPLAQPSR